MTICWKVQVIKIKIPVSQVRFFLENPEFQSLCLYFDLIIAGVCFHFLQNNYLKTFKIAPNR